MPLDTSVLRRRRAGVDPFSSYSVSGTKPRTVADYQNTKYGEPSGGKATRTTYTDLHVSGGEMQGLVTAHDRDGTLKHNAHNLVESSNDFADTDVWAPLGATVTSDVLPGPLPGELADLITCDGSDANCRVSEVIGGLSYESATIAVFARRGTSDWVYIEHDSSLAQCWFNLATGTVGTDETSGGGAIEDVGDGWYKLSVTRDFNSTLIVRYGVVDGDGAKTVTTGASAYFYGAHVYYSNLPMADVPEEFRVGDDLTYVPTTSQARYLPFLRPHTFNGSEWVKGGIAVAPAATNLFSFSNDISESVWDKTSVVGVGPEDLISANGSAGYILQNENVTSGTTYTQSVDAKANGFDFLQFATSTGFTSGRVNFNLTDGTIGDNDTGGVATMVDVGGGYYRCSLTLTADTSTAGRIIFHAADAASTARLGQLGDGVSGIKVRGLQIEAGSTATPLIVTNGSAVARAAFNPEIKAEHNGYDPAGLSISMSGKMTYADTDSTVSPSGTSAGEVTWHRGYTASNDFILGGIETGSTRTGAPVFGMRDPSTDYSDIDGGFGVFSPGINVPFEAASSYAPDSLAGAVNGVALTRDDTITALTDLAGVDIEVGPALNGFIDSVVIYPPLTDAQLETASEV